MTEQDPILAELNGDSKPNQDLPPFVGGVGPEAAPERESELTITPRAPTSRVRTADAVHSTQAGGAGYAVEVEGEYYADNPSDPRGHKGRKPFKLSFNVPRLEGCQALIKNKLLLQALRRKYPDARRQRTFSIVSSKPLNPATPRSRNLAYMDRVQLEDYVLAESPQLPIRLDTYAKDNAGTIALRESIIDYIQNPDPQGRDKNGDLVTKPGDPGTFLFRERERQRSRIEDQELRALNPDLAPPGAA